MLYEQGKSFPCRKNLGKLINTYGKRFEKYADWLKEDPMPEVTPLPKCPGPGEHCFSCPLPDCTNNDDRIYPWEAAALRACEQIIPEAYLADTPGKRIQYIRYRENISRSQLARQLGTTKQIIYAWEMDRCAPGPKTIEKIKKKYGTDITEAIQCAE